MTTNKFKPGDEFRVISNGIEGRIVDQYVHLITQVPHYRVYWPAAGTFQNYEVAACDPIWELINPPAKALNPRFQPGDHIQDGPNSGKIQKIIKTSRGCGWDYEVLCDRTGVYRLFDVSWADKHWTLLGHLNGAGRGASPVLAMPYGMTPPALSVEPPEESPYSLKNVSNAILDKVFDKKVCLHNMVPYVGLFEQFKHCSKCGEKE